MQLSGQNLTIKRIDPDANLEQFFSDLGKIFVS